MNAAVIGLGPQGLRIIKALQAIPGMEIKAVVDSRPQALDHSDIPLTARRHQTATSLWQDARIDLVCIATNGPSHAPLVLEAMAAGATHVMVEKPMACSVVDCERMIDQARARKVRLAVNHARRYDPGYRWLREQARSGVWGSPRALWIQRPGIGLGCLGVHSFDLVSFFTDRPIEGVQAWIDEPVGTNPRGPQFVDPGGMVLLHLGGSLRACVAQIEDGAGPMSIEMNYTKARIRLDDWSGDTEIIERDCSVRPGPNRPPPFQRSQPPQELRTRPDMGVMLAGLFKDLLGDGPMDSDASFGKATIEILMAAYVSQRLGNVLVKPATLAAEDRARCLPVT